MKFLDYGTRFIFTKDYITETREYKKGAKCNTLNNIVVLGLSGEYLFDIDSKLARKFGKIINE
ncbi:hypothetical protein HMPREF1092_00907 [Clostridium thermobutyricum]|uniref:Uncharacterized protein n=1 Tax=Clostridium thermobutyricum TaxID=29372 RepID=N9XPQ2_9CLOT|nr:hypothetical protein [Clostridium thermobutyricum]ENZ01673.1 hypothetical protein HMPREF1092_00907 [Clostridium thermobutyricum]